MGTAIFNIVFILFGLGGGDKRVADKVVICTVGCYLAPFGVLSNTSELVSLNGRAHLLGVGGGTTAQPSR